jgi:hypothetical protein
VLKDVGLHGATKFAGFERRMDAVHEVLAGGYIGRACEGSDMLNEGGRWE